MGEVAARDRHGRRDRARLADDRSRLLPLGLAERLAEQRAELGARVRVAQRDEHRERVDALGKVLARRLAELAVFRDDVEDVVAELEDHPERAPELGERVHLVAPRSARQRADPAGRRHEGCGLAGDGREVVLLTAVRLEARPHLDDLSLAQLPEGRGEEPGGFGPQRGCDRRGAREEVVPGHDRHQVAVPAVHALDVAPYRRLVDHVVVVEGGQVDELDCDAPEQVVLARGALPSRRCDQGERGTEPLPARRDEMRRDVIEEALPGHDRSGEQGLEALQVLLDHRQVEGLRGIHATHVTRRVQRRDILREVQREPRGGPGRAGGGVLGKAPRWSGPGSSTLRRRRPSLVGIATCHRGWRQGMGGRGSTAVRYGTRAAAGKGPPGTLRT